MTDLFTRLAQRAVSGAAPGLRADVDPEPVFGDGEQEPEVQAAVVPAPAPVPAPQAAEPPTPAAPPPAAPEPPSLAPPLTAVPSVVPAPAVPAAPAAPAAPVTLRERTLVVRAPEESPAAVHTETVAPAVVAPPPAVVAPVRVPVPGALVAPLPEPAAAPRRAAVPEAPAGPPVEVTIGRVEIRVRPPAAPPVKPERPVPAPAPALPLDEYLRRRQVSS